MDGTKASLKKAELLARTGAFTEAALVYEALAKQFTRLGNAQNAVAVYRQLRKVLSKSPGDVDSQYGEIVADVADLYERLGFADDARAGFDEAAKRWAQQGRNAEAAAALKRIVALDPSPRTRVRFAEGLARSRDIDGAVRELEVAAREYANEGNSDHALRVLERLLHHRLDVEHARSAAKMYLARRKPKDGVRALQKLRPCYVLAPRDIDVLTLVERAFALAGYTRRAFETQKEIARVARDTGRDALFCETVQRLVESAPGDATVRELAREANVVAARKSYSSMAALKPLHLPDAPPRPVRPVRLVGMLGRAAN